MVSVLALREQFEHMGNHSGYDRLYNYLPENISVDSVKANFKKIYPRGVGRALANVAKLTSPSTFYNAQSVEAESALLRKLWKNNYDVIHYSYGEPYLGLGAMFKAIVKPALVITNHQPVSWWEANKALFGKYKKMDKVITLSEYDRDYFNDKLPQKSVYIPHGVDTDFFKPAKSKPESTVFKVIFAGRYLRDMATLAVVVKSLSSTIADVQFDLVADANDPEISSLHLLDNVNCYSDITEQHLLELYQEAHCCLIPLTDCTANNAVLEAMACGIPVISTDLPAIKTYLDDSCAILGSSQTAEDLCDAIRLLYNNPALVEKMGTAARHKALAQFSWDIIGATTAHLYTSLV